jgi:hypothetical protein
MDLTEATTTLFAILIPKLQFELSPPVAVWFLLVCAVAWLLMVVDMRRRPTRHRNAERQPVETGLPPRPWAAVRAESRKP